MCSKNPHPYQQPLKKGIFFQRGFAIISAELFGSEGNQSVETEGTEEQHHMKQSSTRGFGGNSINPRHGEVVAQLQVGLGEAGTRWQQRQGSQIENLYPWILIIHGYGSLKYNVLGCTCFVGWFLNVLLQPTVEITSVERANQYISGDSCSYVLVQGVAKLADE